MDRVIKSESDIRQRFQTTIPQEIRDKVNLEIGDTLLWMYDDIRNEIVVMPKPKSFSDAIWGLGEGLWENKYEEKGE
ncbi:AbrB/MazE/SpoVT family DNA-binding domain-containing protein [Aquibacillus saliphilus]|uniref:AbrB/MazE/SpoVT family DNA-binding domain-containing protein n=1 Tax=Aquibacillus saliphilus TaxID=1909422 RepID=UPI001CF04E3D|nr:AbrB/MazE/SpoVT family DNA-binding domain-containing protein [Aquibacillus saliphilus]